MELEESDEVQITATRGVCSGRQFVDFNCNFCDTPLKMYENDADPLGLRPPIKRPAFLHCH
jgi:hypothetical protein